MWAQILNTALGLWLMAAPGVLDYNGVAADNGHIFGPVIASFAIIALSGCTRAVALYNAPLGIWLFLSPLFLGYDSGIAVFNDMAVGFFVSIFSFFKRTTNEQYGGGWSSIWRPASIHELRSK